jgi:AbiV family abortive infection protein
LSGAIIQLPIDNEFDSQLGEIAANVRRLVDDSRVLVGDNSQIHAAAMSVFALEELVKYRCLKEGRKSAVAASKTVLNVDGRIFGLGRKTHDFKLNLAKEWKMIPDDAWEVHTGAFSSKTFSLPWFDTERVLDAQLRMESIFVDYDRNKHVWINPPSVDADKLEHSNESILKALEEIESQV